ncbi:P-loop containing nucleoside triphosphate hydrolase protein [Microstroma glucosiphilum]|uniref:P-loop containing nucleoside triphosphate hydrolase protein n=1 Tax=Pseudomicrostroma glucosiphilum TaxID=1684307 RepID=A0A316TZY5_9BASI|nr:P-loop containing nucleoside triphosphate hydrolase protein [Pseudomicrostroma glucosiphilum]PWN17813.1 P-loop containing nucleoside triphosphate hydrolase protein [Pseudomicrostroma glucosiphilum]
MAPRKKSAQIKSSGATSSKAAPLPDWVKNKGAKPPPPGTAAASSASSAADKGGKADKKDGKGDANGGSAVSTAGPSSQPVRPPPLFPPGTKTPLNLLNERVQKLHKDWNRPEYHPHPVRASTASNQESEKEETSDGNFFQYDNGKAGQHEGNGSPQPWTCYVTLSRPNPKDKSTNDVVRLVPDERDSNQRFAAGMVESKEMARHYGATYALFRLFSQLSLALMLPPQFRDYWSSLEAWKKSLPPHIQATLFAPDPFLAQEQARAAKKEREQQALKKAQIKADSQNNSGIDEDKLPKRWKEAREVRMTKSMRDWVEEIVKAGSISTYDDEADDLEEDGGSSSASPLNGNSKVTIDTKRLEAQLSQLGFRSGYISSGLSWLARARSALLGQVRVKDHLVASIKQQSDHEALLTYLTLYVPEEDLPDRFKASKNSTNEGFVTSTQRGQSKEDALKTQWAAERIVKAAGYPRNAVEAAITSESGGDVGARELAALRSLAGRLGQEEGSADGVESLLSARRLEARREEVMVLKSILGDDRLCPVPVEERPLGCTDCTDDCFDVIIAGPSRMQVEGGGKWGKEEIRLRVVWKMDPYPTLEGEAPVRPTFYVASPALSTSYDAPRLPSYLRLALTRHLLKKLQTETWLEDGQALLPMIEDLEENWRAIVNGDKVRFEEVMAGFTTRRPKAVGTDTKEATQANSSRQTFAPARPLRRDAGIDSTLLNAQQAFKASPGGQKLLSQRATLPISHHYDSIVSTLLAHRLTLLTGSTGSGKTTQLPQYILDSSIEAGVGSECKIIVTQPRRVSAMSIAERVAHERGETIGNMVGWAVRGEKKVGRANRILFTTTGLLLRRLQTEPDLASISHLLIDEIHERSLDSDLLLLEIASLLKMNPKIKVVLMSATLQKEKFIKYFAGRIDAGEQGIGSVDVEGRIHPVDDFYLEDLVKETGYRPSAASSSSSFGRGGMDRGAGPLKGLREDLTAHGFSEGEITALEVLERERPGQAVGPLDFELVGRAVKHVALREAAKEQASNDGRVGAILVFMTGVGEIRQACEAIRSTLQGMPIEVLPLHSNLSNEEQQQVFRPVRAGARKIVVSTNVAEASITIDGVTAVIDSGRVKETSYDPDTGLTRLVEKYTSRSSAMQRRGRAGRTRRGECWKLFTRTLEEKKMPQDSQPEMTRVALESVVLHALSMKKKDVTTYLSSALDPPSMASISSAITNLLEAGAVRSLASREELTPTALGRHLTNLPLDLRLGKLLILGCTFQCLSPLLTIAALMSCKPLFAIPYEKRDDLNVIRERKAVGKSDLLTDAAIYDEWASIRRKGGSNAEMRNFAADNYLSSSSLRDITSTRIDLLSNLQEIGFVPRKGYNPVQDLSSPHPLDTHSTNHALLRGLLTAALWPSMIRIAHPEAKYNQGSSGTIARETEARSVKLFDEAGRVFLQPSSVLFGRNKFEASHLACFKKSAGAGDKVYLRDATEAPIYALLLFCGRIKIHHLRGGISLASSAGGAAAKQVLTTTGGAAGAAGAGGSAANSGKSSRVATPVNGAAVGFGGQEPRSEVYTDDEGEGFVRLRAPARIGVLSSQLRRLLDAHLDRAFDRDSSELEGEGGANGSREEEEQRSLQILEVMRALLERDGMGTAPV